MKEIKEVKKGKNNNVMIVGLMLLVVSLSLLGVVLFLRSKKLSVNLNTTLPKTAEEDKRIALYTNNKYGYKVKYPATIKYKLTENKGGYLESISFLANIDTFLNGFVIAVNDLPLNEEVERIKKSFSPFEAELIEEKNIKVFEYDAKELYYKPKDFNYGDEKKIVVFQRDGFTYSISTAPEYLEELLSNFSLITIITPTPNK